MPPNEATPREYKAAHVCAHADVVYKNVQAPTQNTQTLNTGEGHYQEEEMWGLKIPGVLLSLVPSLSWELQDLLSHWGHWAQRACKETHSEHEAQSSVCSLSAQAVLKTFLCCCSITCRSELRH